jgi:glycosyltransferase involved in cell wall biosynthesis
MTDRRILYVQYTSPSAYPPLEHSSRLLAEAGWEVLFLGITKHDDPDLRWPSRQGISVHELAPSDSGWRRKLHYAMFALWVFGWMVRWRPKWIYASDALACPVVLPLSYWPGVHIVYHEHDAPQVTGRGAVSRLVLWARRRLATRASARVLPNERRARHFSNTVANHRPTFNVWNCPSRTEVTPARAAHRGDGLRILYVGSIVPFRLPKTLIEALALLPDSVELRVIGYWTQGHRNYVAELRDFAGQLGLADRVQFVGGMPHPELLITTREADVGVVLMPAEGDGSSVQWMPGASNKPFDYLASGLPVLVSDLPGWRDMFVEPGYGLACTAEDPHSVAAALRWLVDHPTDMRAMGERGRQRVAAEWNYETQFAPVQAWLDLARN